MQGNTLLLDVNSNTPGAPPVSSAQDCCLACMANARVMLLSTVSFPEIFSITRAVCCNETYNFTSPFSGIAHLFNGLKIYPTLTFLTHSWNYSPIPYF